MRCKYCGRGLDQPDPRSTCRACSYIVSRVKDFVAGHPRANPGDFLYYLLDIGYKSSISLEVLSKILVNHMQGRGFSSKKSGYT